MQPFDLVGPSYTSQSPNLSDQLTMNMYVESSEGEGQSPAALYPTPGLKVFCDLTDTPIRGEITVNDRTFVVAGSKFYEIFSDGTFHLYGSVLNDDTIVSMAGGATQIIIASAGMVYIFDFSTGHIQTATINQGGNNGVLTSSLGAGGTGYAPGDTFTISAGNMDATGVVDTAAGGIVSAYHLTSVGTNYAIAGAVPTASSGVQPGSGTGLTINVLTLGGGYAVNDTGAIQGVTPSAMYIVTTIDGSGNVTGFTITNGGSQYTLATNVLTITEGAQPGIGAGFTVNIAAVGVTNSFAPLPNGTLLGPVSFVAYIEGFFVALLASSNQFQWSAPLDATTWDPLDTNKVSVFAGNVLSMLADHNELWFWGERQSQPYALTGSANTFDIIPGAFLEAGIYAPNSPVRIDNSIMWLGGDERGAGVVWRANGYTPQRVSNHAIEFALQGYLTTYGAVGLSNAVGYSYQDQGHSFYVLYFPSPSATWVYDTATGMWHQRGYWNSASGKYSAHLSQCHTFNFGKHLVGDRSSGKVYDMNISYYDDAGNPKRWVRRTRTASANQTYVFHKVLQIYAETGVGPQPPLLSPAGITGTRVQNGATLGAVSFMFFETGTSVLGRSYFLSVQVTNNSATQLQVGVGLVANGFPTYINQGETALVSITVTGDGIVPLTMFFLGEANNSGLDFTAGSPLILDQVTSANLIPAISLDYSTGWNPSPSLLTLSTVTGALPRGPYLNLRWSNDGGHTWSNEQTADIGQAGNYGNRIMFRRLGRARSRVYELSGSDPAPYRLVGAFLDVSAGEGA